MTRTPTIVNGQVFWAPPDALSLRLATETAPVLQFSVLVPIDLTDSHGIDVTAARLQEMANAYDPSVEMASLNFDHAWGGPSYGWCEEVWVQDGALWVRYGDLSPEAVDGVRTRRFTRRSAEIALEHPVTGGWYFTGCALLGNARPAVPGLPPLTLCRPQYVLIGSTKETKMENEDPAAPAPPTPAAAPPAAPPAATATPPPAEQQPPAAGAAELAALNAQVAAGDRALTTILRRAAVLEVRDRLATLGNRVTPAMARLARPLLEELFAQPSPLTVQLQDDPAQAAAPVVIAERLLQILAACPPIEALTAGRLAEPGAALAAAIATHPPLAPERLAELEAKYGYSRSFGFRSLISEVP
jgi:hypothetical protein